MGDTMTEYDIDEMEYYLQKKAAAAANKFRREINKILDSIDNPDLVHLDYTLVVTVAADEISAKQISDRFIWQAEWEKKHEEEEDTEPEIVAAPKAPHMYG